MENIVSYMCNLHNIVFNQSIGSLCMKPTLKCHFNVPLCHLMPLHMVRPMLEVNVMLFKNEFVNAYHEGDIVCCVFVMNNARMVEEVTQAI